MKCYIEYKFITLKDTYKDPIYQMRVMVPFAI